MSEAPTTFVPTGGKASGFRQALANYAARRGGYKQGPSRTSDVSFGQEYLTDKDKQQDMSNADLAYLQSTGGDVSGLMGQYLGDSPETVAANEAARRRSASDRYWAAVNKAEEAGTGVNFSESDFYNDPDFSYEGAMERARKSAKPPKYSGFSFADSLSKWAQDLWNKPYIGTVPKAIGNQIKPWADYLQKNTYL